MSQDGGLHRDVSPVWYRAEADTDDCRKEAETGGEIGQWPHFRSIVGAYRAPFCGGCISTYPNMDPTIVANYFIILFNNYMPYPHICVLWGAGVREGGGGITFTKILLEVVLQKSPTLCKKQTYSYLD